MPTVRLETTGGVARVTLDRPPLNVIDLVMARDLAATLERVSAHAEVRAVLIEGSGRAFCAGVDVRDHLPDRGAEMLAAFHDACRRLHGLAAPVVCAVGGAALGGGCELTMMCDVVIASDTATFGQPEIKLGVFPPLASVVLPRRVPPALARDLLLTGRTITAEQACSAGLVSRVIPEAQFERGVASLLVELSALSPASLRMAKRAYRSGRLAVDFDEVDAAERLYVDELINAPDAVEGLRAFLEKRAPRWGA